MVGACICLVWLLAWGPADKRGVWNAQSQLITMICLSVQFWLCRLDVLGSAHLLLCGWVTEMSQQSQFWGFSSACRIMKLMQSRRCLPLNRNTPTVLRPWSNSELEETHLLWHDRWCQAGTCSSSSAVSSSALTQLLHDSHKLWEEPAPYYCYHSSQTLFWGGLLLNSTDVSHN